MIQIAGNQSAPEGEVHERTALGRSEFFIEALHIQCWRMRIERHVEEKRAATSRKRFGTRFDSFPVCATRLVKMDMRIDQTGQDVQPFGINRFARRIGQALPKLDNLPIKKSDG